VKTIKKNKKFHYYELSEIDFNIDFTSFPLRPKRKSQASRAQSHLFVQKQQSKKKSNKILVIKNACDWEPPLPIGRESLFICISRDSHSHLFLTIFWSRRNDYAALVVIVYIYNYLIPNPEYALIILSPPAVIFSESSTTFTGATPRAVVVFGFSASMMVFFRFYGHRVTTIGTHKIK